MSELSEKLVGSAKFTETKVCLRVDLEGFPIASEKSLRHSLVSLPRVITCFSTSLPRAITSDKSRDLSIRSARMDRSSCSSSSLSIRASLVYSIGSSTFETLLSKFSGMSSS